MVDVSGSMNQSFANESKSVIVDFLLGKGINSPNFQIDQITVPTFNGQTPLISGTKRIFITPFGYKDTWRGQKDMVLGANYQSELTNFINNSFPAQFDQKRTYLTWSRANVFLTAKNMNIPRFVLITVSDHRGDVHGSNVIYTQDEINLMNSVDMAGANVRYSTNSWIKYIPDPNFRLKFESVDVTGWTPPRGPGGGGTGVVTPSLPPPPPVPPVIKFISYATGTRTKPIEVTGEKVNLSWSCNAKDITYRLTITEIDGNGNSVKKSNLKNTNFSTSLESGTYKIMVSGKSPDKKSVKSATTYIEIPRSSGFIYIFILIAIAAAGYFVYKKQQQTKLEKLKNIVN